MLENEIFSEFEYFFTPKNKDDDLVKLLAVFQFDEFEIEIPAFAPVVVSD